MVAVQPGQTLLDVAVQEFGNALALFDIARYNGLSLTDEVKPGTLLKMPAFVEPEFNGIEIAYTSPIVVVSEVIVKQGQTFFDVAVQHCGDATAAIDIARLNGYSLTDTLKPGTWLILPAVIEAGIVGFFKDNEYIPATGVISPGGQPEERPIGIGYWIIEKDFKVS